MESQPDIRSGNDDRPRTLRCKEPRFGQQGGGAVALDVPWRQGTAVNSATRTQLLLILSRSTKLPVVEVLESQLAVVRDNQRESWNLSMLLYVTPATSDRVVIAGHRVSATHETEGDARVGPYSGEVTILPMRKYAGQFTGFSTNDAPHPTIRSTNLT